MDNNLSAIVTIIGMTCDVMGGLYLAYDLLGGENGPLARLTKIVNYSVLIVLLFLIPMGFRFALIVGFGFGIPLGLHLDRAGRNIPDSNAFLMSTGMVRGVAMAAALWPLASPLLAILMGCLVCTMSYVLPKVKISPALVYQSGKKPQFHWKQLLLVLFLGGLSLSSGLFGASITHADQKTLLLVVKFCLTFATMILVVTSISPVIEWYSDNLPPKTFGTAGIILFITGFVIQALPSLVTIFEMTPQ